MADTSNVIDANEVKRRAKRNREKNHMSQTFLGSRGFQARRRGTMDNGGYIFPKQDCWHLFEIELTIPVKWNDECSCCGDSSESWFCLCCSNIFCSRYVKVGLATIVFVALIVRDIWLNIIKRILDLTKNIALRLV